MINDKEKIAAKSAATYGAGAAATERFMNDANSQDRTMFPDDNASVEGYKPGSKFLQKMLNISSGLTGKPMLKEDGIMGPVTQKAIQGMIRDLSPEMKTWAVGLLQKAQNTEPVDPQGIMKENIKNIGRESIKEGLEEQSQNIANKGTVGEY